MAHRGRLLWEDLRLVLALAETGTPAGAGRSLALDPTTVTRRLDALEARLAVRLFERLAGGYVPSPAGERMLATAREVEETVAGLDRRLAGLDARLTGRLRVTTTDTLMASTLPAALAAFRASHPGVGIDLVSANALFTLVRRDADVAVRPSEAAPEGLVARRVAGVAFAVYAAPSIAGRGARDLAETAWVVPGETLAGIGAARWLRAHRPEARVAARANALTAIAALAAAGLGLALLPCYLGDLDPGLVRVDAGPAPMPEAALWLVTHPDIAAAPRVRTLVDVLAAELGRDADLFEGRRMRRP